MKVGGIGPALPCFELRERVTYLPDKLVELYHFERSQVDSTQ